MVRFSGHSFIRRESASCSPLKKGSMTLRAFFRGCSTLLAWAGLDLVLPDQVPALPIVPTNFYDELIASGFDAPTNMSFLPDGRLLVVEQYTAKVRLLVNESVSPVDPVGVVAGVRSGGEAGLLGVVVDPGWPVRPYVYVHATEQGTSQVKIWRYNATGDLDFSGNGAFTIDPDSRHTVIALPDQTPNHNGGTIRFDQKGMLLVTIGDDGNACAAQDLTKLQGKILRLDVLDLPDGAGGPPLFADITPADNPFVAHPDPAARLVWAYGLRNPFSFTIDPVTGCLYIGDVGNALYEEINVACEGGRNFGWPFYEGPSRWPGSCAVVSDTTNMVQAAFAYPQEDLGWAVLAGPIYRTPPGATAPYPPALEGQYFLADTWRWYMQRLDTSGPVWTIADSMPGQPDAEHWATRTPWVTSLNVGPDGSLWYTQLYQPNPNYAHNGVRRIRYLGEPLDVEPDASSGSGRRGDGTITEFAAPQPSPTRGSVRLAWRQSVPAPVSLAIHDARGRLVRRLSSTLEGVRAAGEQAVTWDGKSNDGIRAPAGVYFARLGVLEDRRAVRFVVVQ